MREIKFRAWNEYMTTSFDIQKDDPDSFPLSEKIPLMQFTGLKDKNGVEIYEGDIFYSLNGHYQIKFGEWKYFSSGALVSMLGFFAERIEGGTKSQRSLYPDHIEIIGNIYQNPELLK